MAADVKFISNLKVWANSQSYGGLLVSMLLAFLYLSWLYPSHFISGASSYWLAQNEDITQYIAGFNAFVMEPWQWPLLRISSLNWPDGTLATFVDAIPLYALILKIGLHGTASLFNPYGLWVAICYVLQAVGAWWILREAQIRSWLALASLTVLLLVFPALGYRLGHISLMSHWLILFAYAIYLRSSRIGNLALYSWMILIIIAFYINIYIFTMVSIIFFSDVLRFQQISGIARAFKALALPFVLLLLSMIVTMLPLPGGAGGSEWGFGYYSMNILSPFAGGRFLQWPHPVAQDGQGEGFNYLGIAMLALTGYALVLRRREDTDFFIRHKFLLICLVATTVYALSNRVYIGSELLFEWYEPNTMKTVTGQFRASGRFFWIVGYGMFIFTVVTIVRFVKPSKTFWLLIVVVIFQWWDLSMQQAQVQATASRSVETHLNPVLWDQYLGKKVKTLYFYPAFRCGKTAMHNSLLPTMLYASERGLNLSTGYIARAVKPCDNYPEQIAHSDNTSSAYVFVREEFPDVEAIQALFDGKSSISCSAIDFAYICKLAY
ncbi:MAG: DUF6311 domain-containing protein [Methylobacter sp.]